MASSIVPAMESALTLQPAKLDCLPAEIIYMIIGYCDRARSVANLAASCRRLRRHVSDRGWRVFVTNRFSSLTLPQAQFADDWCELARTLTNQSRDWDRRAFVAHSLTAPRGTHAPGARRGRVIQSIPGNIIVDARLRRQGGFDEELVIWGAGEDIFARIRRSDRTNVLSENWRHLDGWNAGFSSGRGDITFVSIARGRSPGGIEDSGVVVGRANGDLRLLSTDESNFGHTLMEFRTWPANSSRQPDLKAIDLDHDSGMMVAGTLDGLMLYSNQDYNQAQEQVVDHRSVDPAADISIRDAPQSSPFYLINSVRMMDKETIAVALSESREPLRILQVTPAGINVSEPTRTLCENSRQTVTALLPVDARSVVGGAGNMLLSSWKGGTIQLQDLRTPSPMDRTYQDNFEVSASTTSLVSYGLERFIAGSAYKHDLKIFDFRWPKQYYYTDLLPCSSETPYPTPTPPTIVEEPVYRGNQLSCDHATGRLCRWHSLSRHDFYRPNCNIFLPLIPYRIFQHSPVYSIAKPSDASPTIYAGLSGTLVELTLKSGEKKPCEPSSEPLYVRERGAVALVETGDGFEVSDYRKCQRMPKLRQQMLHNDEHDGPAVGRHHRLDGSLQIQW
ncbi:hypothetical protein F4861DRAFT_510008 [Xylaria intraflava]|nr:hypothetical protein F4861DRAFT_510008 [Xylaria intraflava]